MANYHLSVITASGEAFDGEVESLIAPGAMGSFGVLNGHAAMITSLTSGPLTITHNGQNEYYHVSSGILEVNGHNKVLLLTDYAEKATSLEEAKSAKGSNDGE